MPEVGGGAKGFPPPLTTAWKVAEPPAAWLSQLGTAAGDLPDINVWLALAVQEHPHHAVARRYWAARQPAAGGASAVASSEPSVWFCRVTMLGLVRLLCQPKAVGKGALALPAAWTLYAQYRALPRIGLLPEPAGCDAELHTLVATMPLSPRLWTDAYLAALAKASGLRLVSFDRDFERFGLARCLILPTG